MKARGRQELGLFEGTEGQLLEQNDGRGKNTRGAGSASQTLPQGQCRSELGLAPNKYNGETWEGLNPGKPGSLASYLPALTASFSSLPSPSLISKLFLGSSCLLFDYKSSL